MTGQQVFQRVPTKYRAAANQQRLTPIAIYKEGGRVLMTTDKGRYCWSRDRWVRASARTSEHVPLSQEQRLTLIRAELPVTEEMRAKGFTGWPENVFHTEPLKVLLSLQLVERKRHGKVWTINLTELGREVRWS